MPESHTGPPMLGCALWLAAVIFVIVLGPVIVLEFLGLLFPFIGVTFRFWFLVLGLFLLVALSLIALVACSLAIFFHGWNNRKRGAGGVGGTGLTEGELSRELRKIVEEASREADE